jgi:hypothetical protein
MFRRKSAVDGYASLPSSLIIGHQLVQCDWTSVRQWQRYLSIDLPAEAAPAVSIDPFHIKALSHGFLEGAQH